MCSCCCHWQQQFWQIVDTDNGSRSSSKYGENDDNDLLTDCSASSTSSHAGCSSDGSAACISNEVGDVCADDSNGAITFSASGLAPGSEVQVIGPEEQSFVLQVDGDGAYAPPAGSVGFLYYIANTELTFIVTATDSDGELLEGDIVIST